MSVDQLALVALGLAMLAAAVLMLVLTRRHNLSLDEVNFLLYRGGHGVDTFLEPYNEHVMVAPLLAYKVLFRLFGVDSYLPYRLTVVALHLLCAGVLYALARRRVGALPALVPAVVLLFLGTAWEVVLQLALIVFMLPLAAGLGMFLALERGDRRGDLIASACLLVAIASGSLGMIMAIGATVLILLGPDRGRRMARVVAAPVALYAVWWLAYGEGNLLDQWTDLPRLLIRYLAANVAALAGFTYGAAPVLWTALAALLAVAVGYAIARRVEAWRELVALSAMTLAYWASVALFRPPLDELASRYIYPGSAFLLLLMAFAYGRRRIPPAAGAAVVVALALVVASQLGDLRDGARSLDRRAEFLGPSLGALELARGQVADDFVPEPTRAPGATAGRYFSATGVFGSPADSPDEIVRRPEEPRRAADIVSSRALGVRLHGVTKKGFRKAYPGCRAVDLEGDVARRDMLMPRAGLAFQAPADGPLVFRFRRFAAGYGRNGTPPGERYFTTRLFQPLLTPLVLVLVQGESALLRIPADPSPVRWHLRLSGRGSALVCPISS